MSTERQSRNSHFKPGCSVYTCRICNHKTRNTGGGGSSVGACDLCYELAGEENHISDSGGQTYGSKDAVTSRLLDFDLHRGPGAARRIFPTVCDAVGYQVEQTVEPEHKAEPEAQAKTIDLTPTWSAVLPILLAAIESGNEEGRRIAKLELSRMAQAADQFNARA